MSRKILTAAVGNCVHVAGIQRFLRLAQSQGYETHFLGPAVSIDALIEGIERYDPEVVGLSYRLTPEVAEGLINDFIKKLDEKDLKGRTFLFSGPPPVAEVAQASGIFERVFSGAERTEEVVAFLRGEKGEGIRREYAGTLIERLQESAPTPLLRHHFGLPSLRQTVEGVKTLALSRQCDVVSIGPDQNAQASFFRPEEMDPGQDGAGGVPVRRPEDLRRIYEASRCGNYPLLRCYAGTRDLIQWGMMLKETIHIAWGAVPLCWYNRLDGRSNRPLRKAIEENQQAMAWYAAQNIPVEVNEAHHWSIREASDTVGVTMAFLAAYNAKRLGVTHYVSQYMFNTPPATSPIMDLAKMAAKIELIEGLHDEAFTTYRQVRSGLMSFSPDPDVAKGQLAASVQVAMALRPHILHVVGFCEGDHAARPQEIVESCKIVRGVLQNWSLGPPEMLNNHAVEKRKRELMAESRVLLDAIRALAPEEVADPWTDAATLTRAIETGLIDAPHLEGNPWARGEMVTAMIDGACRVVDPQTGQPEKEEDRTERILRLHGYTHRKS
ncbi:MAG: cobalamin B12-binding domain-containing protein [bacterium]